MRAYARNRGRLFFLRNCQYDLRVPSRGVILTMDFEMPKRRQSVAVDPAKSKTLDRKQSTRENVVEFKRSFSVRVQPSQCLHRSIGGDPGPAGFDWIELKSF